MVLFGIVGVFSDIVNVFLYFVSDEVCYVMGYILVVDFG